MKDPKEVEKKIADILGLETDPHGTPNMFLIRDEHGVTQEGADFNDEVAELSEFLSQEKEKSFKAGLERVRNWALLGVDNRDSADTREQVVLDAGYISALNDLLSFLEEAKSLPVKEE